MDTRTDAALLQLMWLASPALPVGGFSYSEGLEAAVEAALVHDEASAGEWLAAQLQLSLARADLAVVAAAVHASRSGNAARLAALDAWVRQTRETSELRLQAEQMGRSMGEWQRSVAAVRRPDASSAGWGDAGSPAIPGEAGLRCAQHQPAAPTYPVAFAVAASTTPADARSIALAFAFSWAENMVQAALKSVPLGQSSGQRILARLVAAVPHAIDLALALDDASRQSFTPMLAILSSQHEVQYSRLFRS